MADTKNEADEAQNWEENCNAMKEMAADEVGGCAKDHQVTCDMAVEQSSSKSHLRDVTRYCSCTNKKNSNNTGITTTNADVMHGRDGTG